MPLDPRIVRVGVEVNGQLRLYEDLDISVQIEKFANPLMNVARVEITNLSRETRDFLLTETSPFNANRTPKRLVVEVGRVSSGTTRAFLGDITLAEPSRPPDIRLTLQAQTMVFKRGDIITRKGGDRQSLRSLAGLVAQDCGLSLIFEATDKTIGNYSYSGAAAKQVDYLAQAGGVDVYVDDDRLIVKNLGEPLRNTVRILSLDTGLIGIPEQTEVGIRARMLIDQQTTLGGALRIVSQVNPSLNGDYTIYKLVMRASTRDLPFWWEAEARRFGFTSQAEKDAELDRIEALAKAPTDAG